MMERRFHTPTKRMPLQNLKSKTEQEILKPSHLFKGSRSLHASRRPPSIITATLDDDRNQFVSIASEIENDQTVP
jgi:hypothetical protein